MACGVSGTDCSGRRLSLPCPHSGVEARSSRCGVSACRGELSRTVLCGHCGGLVDAVLCGHSGRLVDAVLCGHSCKDTRGFMDVSADEHEGAVNRRDLVLNLNHALAAMFGI